MQLRRKLYSRGGSHETTIPKPLLFALDTKKQHDVLFSYDGEKKRWHIEFEERDAKERTKKTRGKSVKDAGEGDAL